MNALESLPNNLSNLIHLQYLKISSPFGLEMTLPSTLSRFYHLKFLDLSSWYGSSNLPKDISRLVNLRDFLAKKELHSNVPEVGKMKYLHELKEFHVKKESVGFDLREMGELRELGGTLSIHNLETVATKDEARKAKLVSKGDLKGLRLVWGELDASESSDGSSESSDALDGPTESSRGWWSNRKANFCKAELSDVLDGLEPHPNLQSLGIIDHGGSVGPHWLCGHMSIKMLVSLHLEGVSWSILPPFGQLFHLRSLTLIHISTLVQIRPGVLGVTARSFT